jgi:hypothetical protein
VAQEMLLYPFGCFLFRSNPTGSYMEITSRLECPTTFIRWSTNLFSFLVTLLSSLWMIYSNPIVSIWWSSFQYSFPILDLDVSKILCYFFCSVTRA